MKSDVIGNVSPPQLPESPKLQLDNFALRLFLYFFFYFAITAKINFWEVPTID
jgi:hypothetical protein